jgi:hypothetical protein
MFPLANTGFFKTNQGFAFGNALQFDGVNDRVAFDASQISISTEFGLSVSFWIEIDESQTNPFVIFTSGGNNVGVWYFGTTFFQVRVNGFANRSQFSFNFLEHLGQKLHFVVRLTVSDGVTVHCNDIQLARTISNGVADTWGVSGIGKFNSSVSPGKFKMDELAIFENQVLTLEDITYLYNEGNGNLATDVGNPLIYYRFNGSGSSTVAINEGTLSINGVLENFTAPPDFWVPF